jgi:hypothetical protein
LFNVIDLHEIESKFGFKYPSAFYVKFQEFIEFTKTSAFRAQFPNASLVSSVDDLRECYKIEKELKTIMIPFMFQRQLNHTDYYGFNKQGDAVEMSVIVYAQDAIVHDWTGFDAFFLWAQQLCRSEYR